MRTLKYLWLRGLLLLIVLPAGCGKPDAASTAKCKGETSSKNACDQCCQKNGVWGHNFVQGIECECLK
jgi:hypothetical protein